MRRLLARPPPCTFFRDAHACFALQLKRRLEEMLLDGGNVAYRHAKQRLIDEFGDSAFATAKKHVVHRLKTFHLARDCAVQGQ